MTLENILPDEDYGFRLRFDQGPIGDFFRESKHHEILNAQRRHWLQSTPRTCIALLPEGVPLLDETLSLAHSQSTLPSGMSLPASPAFSSSEQILKLGELWEPDFLLLQPTPDGRILLLAGCVCFPSSWSLEEKIGLHIEEIHGIVPGLNATIGPQIHRFLAKLRPNIAWLRANWGLSRSPELNQHPSRKLPRLDASVEVDEIWLRIENQALVSLPATGGILFGIRIANYPFQAVLTKPELCGRFIRALKTMPEPMAQYKGIAPARARLISLLQDFTA